MEREEALALFENLTGAAPHVAEHVLDAHGWDVNSAVEWYLESGGVGHGIGADAPQAVPASPPDYIEEPDDEPIIEEPPEVSAAARILDDDDDDIQVLASSLGRRRPGRVEEVADDEHMHPVGSVEDELGGAAAMGRRVRRNRRRLAGEVDRDLELLGQRFGVMDEFQPAPTAQQHQAQQQQQRDDDEDFADLPADVDLEEQRMLMAAIQGGGYEGHIPDFAADPRYQPRVLSPGAQARQNLREEQDAAYYESLRADQEKAEAAERERREAEQAAAAAAAAAEAEERRQREETQRLERQLTSKAASLPAEPPADDAEAVNLMVRLPAGGRYSRRFRRSDPLQAVFDFVDVQSGLGGDIAPGTYHFATAFPRRVLEDGASAQTLEEAGLSAKQEALFLELK
ncbi:hypothetical protein COHA_008969 [Chlorella ohadii]|uniref:UBX domain-containing protein n=1 Tax=Chlorella ohadii TaxID=2649997 RepID=A0AAD5DHV6_9CHLO|nr:hypothetical protein COHA_008969 [Chlorella ohadii]